MLKFLILSISIMVIGGCASVPRASLESDTQAKQFVTPQGQKAGLYLLRKGTFYGGALQREVKLNGKLVGKLGNATYYYLQVSPGKYTVSTESSFGENSIDLIVESGKNYFVNQYLGVGLVTARTDLEVFNEEDGKREVSTLEMLETNYK